MTKFRTRMWTAGEKLMLQDVLRRLQFHNQPTWVLFEFFGVGRAPNGLEISMFEKKVLDSPSGYRFDSVEFHEFVESLQDVSDVNLIGVLGDQRKIVEIKGMDSTYWEIWFDDAAAHFSAAADQANSQASSWHEVP